MQVELVSVVVPVYKVEPYLEKCVKSITAQSYKNLEIILVDDGSPDRCGEMCDAYVKEDPRIRVIHKKNGGLSDARNAGAARASGKYLLFVDSDDAIDGELVEKAVATAEKHRSDIVLFDYYCVENGNREVREASLPTGKVLNLKEEKELLLAPPSAWTKLFRREFYEKSGCSFPVGKYFEDLATTPVFFLKAERIVYLDEPLYDYMIRENSIMTGKNYEKSCRDKLAVLDHIQEVYRQAGVYETYRDELEYLVFANAYFEPSKELALDKADRRSDRKWLDTYRKYLYGQYPDFMKNPYVRRMGRKDQLHLWILNTRQYWLMRLLSYGRRLRDRMKGRT